MSETRGESAERSEQGSTTSQPDGDSRAFTWGEALHLERLWIEADPRVDRIVEQESTEPLQTERALRDLLEADAPDPEQPIEEQPPTQPYLGLGFSGGGIRSATFNLGILQGLARLNLLRRVHYLSTVSGGGYIGSWLSAWVQRAGGVDIVEAELKKRDCDVHSINYLREFSNYLTPKTGLFSSDTWTVVSMYLRNLVLNLLVLTLGLVSVVAFPQALYLAFRDRHDPQWTLGIFSFLVVATIALIVMMHFSRLGLRCSRYHPLLIRFIAVPFLILASATFAHWIWVENPAHLGSLMLQNFVGTASMMLLFLAVILVHRYFNRGPDGQRSPWLGEGFTWVDLVGSAVVSLLAGLVTGGLFFQLNKLFQRWSEDPRLIFAIGPLLCSLIFTASIIVMLGALGNLLNERAREWWSTFGGSVMLWTTVWTGLAALSFFGPSAIDRLLQAPDWIAPAATSGWIGATITGLLAAKRHGQGKGGAAFRRLAAATPYLFIAGLLLLAAKLVSQLQYAQGLGAPKLDVWISFLNIDQIRTLQVGVLWLVAGLLAMLISVRFDINMFSMNALYRNRLVRCYLGATNDGRDGQVDRYTGFDPEDDLPLYELKYRPKCNQRSDSTSEDAKGKLVHRPFLIINTALNLVAGKKLAWQKRKAVAFSMTPWFCGFQMPDLLKSDDHGAEQSVESVYRVSRWFGNKISLGSAMSISGAAASPNMGYHSTPALNFLFTVFNVRLGAWLGNTRNAKSWFRRGPAVAMISLVRELFGLTRSSQKYVYLSDGGHFENLGLYELVRRRCRYIILSDAEQDSKRVFDGIGNAIEKCRTDFGAEIELDVKPLYVDEHPQHSKWHAAVGTVRYKPLDNSSQRVERGYIVYIKATTTGDEPTDLLKYARANPEFPHQSTADQWFDESQFESYRKLGVHTVESVFAEEVERLVGANEACHADDCGRIDLEQLFVNLSQRWNAPCPGIATRFSEHAAALNQINATIRGTPELNFIDAQIHPEWRELVGDATGRPCQPNYGLPADPAVLRQGFYLCNEMIQFMETVYHDLEFERYFSHPDNRGWLNLFRNWAWSGMFRATWAINGGTYGSRFQRFCEAHLGLESKGFEWEVLIASLGHPEIQLDRNALDQLEAEAKLNFEEVQRIRQFLDHWNGASNAPAMERLRLVGFKFVIESPSDGNRHSDPRFHCGFALVGAHTLYYLRVPDHLRRMGLGRLALYALLEMCDGKLELPAESAFLETIHDPQRIRRFSAHFESAKKAYANGARASRPSTRGQGLSDDPQRLDGGSAA